MARRQLCAFRLDPDLVGRMKTLYDRDGVLPSEQVRRALDQWLDQRGVPRTTDTKRSKPKGRTK
jgi:hypothetical protein